jgi:3-phenylpropionate/cinnamic acid dioxygenase small subunit
MDAIDTLEIHQLLARYGHAIDDRDWTAFAALFIPDAVIDYTQVRAPEVLRGIDAILEFFRVVNHPSAHHVTNIVVTETDGAVRVRSKWFAPYTRATHHPNRWAGGVYDDVVVRTEDGWKFAEKVCIGQWQFTPDGEGEVADHRRSY